METTEEESIQTIRESNRNKAFLNRRKKKDEETDVRRSLGNLQLNTTDVTTIANTLKTKACISASDLKLLQNALVDDVKNVEVVLNTHGALRGLVRELTGHDINKQLASCGCVCNIALGDSKTGCTVAKAAGAYLVAALDSLTTQLAVTCAWALGNIAGSGPRACDVILAQGTVAKLCDVIAHGDEMQDAVVYSLTHLAYTMKDDLSPDHLHKIICSLSTSNLTIDSSQLLFILSCHKDFTPELISDLFLSKIVENLTVSIKNHINICKKSTKTEKPCCNSIYLVRVLANLNNSVIYVNVLDYFVRNNLVVSVRKFLEVEEDRSMWWLLGNMVNCCVDGVFFTQLGEV